MKKTVGWSILLAVTTSAITAVLGTKLSYSPLRDRITDVIALPGAWIASFIYPQGVHTGRGTSWWGITTVGCNLVVYALFWFGCLKLGARLIGEKRQHEAS